MEIERPYFMENAKWYVIDDETHTVHLTSEAPVETVQSFDEYYALFKNKKKEDYA